MAHDIPRRTLGRTGERVSMIGLRGWHLALPQVDEALSIRIIRSAIDAGITFLDNSWDYNDGASETRVGKALANGYRERAFLMTNPHRILDADGAHAALQDARKAGKLRYIGFTGRKDPHIHLYTLDVAREHGVTFDTVGAAECDGCARSQRPATAAAHGEFEPFKTSAIFGSTAEHVEWLGKEPERLQQLVQG